MPSTASEAPRPGAAAVLAAAAASLRPHQWLKNALVFVPLAAAHRLGETPLLARAAAAFVAFCLCASATYLLNDLHDAASDRAHPHKRQRPIAAGRLPRPLAAGMAVALLALAAAVLARLGGRTGGAVALYVALMAAYTLRLRAVVLLNGGLFPETHRPRLVQRLLRTPLGPWIARGITRRRFDASLRAIFGRATPPTRAELDGFWALLLREDGPRAMPRLLRYIDERRRWRARWVGALVRTSVPLSLVAGLDDPVSGRHMVARFRELVPGAMVTELPGIGHYPQLEAPARVLERILAALDG